MESATSEETTTVACPKGCGQTFDDSDDAGLVEHLIVKHRLTPRGARRLAGALPDDFPELLWDKPAPARMAVAEKRPLDDALIVPFLADGAESDFVAEGVDIYQRHRQAAGDWKRDDKAVAQGDTPADARRMAALMTATGWTPPPADPDPSDFRSVPRACGASRSLRRSVGRGRR
jgi:hypothetical protein